MSLTLTNVTDIDTAAASRTVVFTRISQIVQLVGLVDNQSIKSVSDNSTP